MFFFFFQAEDGIRDYKVTGVQTCALPIFVLLLIAAGLFSTGLGKLQALGVLPVTDALWDSSALLSDHSLVGGFATGLVGYRARPTLVEVTGYMLYLITAGALFLAGRRPFA